MYYGKFLSNDTSAVSYYDKGVYLDNLMRIFKKGLEVPDIRKSLKNYMTSPNMEKFINALDRKSVV